MTRFLLLLCAVHLLLQPTVAETIPGYRYPIDVVEDQSVAGAPDHSVLIISLKNAPAGKNRLRVLYETRTRRVLHAAWATGSNALLTLPSMGCYLHARPDKLSSPVVILSAESLEAAGDQKIAFLGILWSGTPK